MIHSRKQQLGYAARYSAFACCLFAIIFIAGCAGNSGSTGQKGLRNGLFEPVLSALEPKAIQALPSRVWAGRISLRIEAEPVQFFSAGFELTGEAAAGSLVLTSPLGNVLGTLRWAPGEAWLDQGNGQGPERFASAEALLVQVTGAPLPLDALFGWLQAKAPDVLPINYVLAAQGWQADLSRRSEGRIIARRMQPLPEAELRILLDADISPAIAIP